VIAVAAAIFGVMWSSDEENATSEQEATTEDTTSSEDTVPPNQPDRTQYLDQVQQQHPDASSEEQEALAAAQAESDMYIVSEYLLEELLTNPQYEYGFSQEATDFAVQNVEVDWNEEAYQFASLAREEYPDSTDEEIENLLQHQDGGPQFTAEQTEYALSKLN
jgi:hypothetical protein